MSQPLTATQLRTRIYKVLDWVLATGQPQEIIRNGQRLLIIPVSKPKRDLEKRPKRQAIACTPEELVETHWDESWRPDL